MTDKDDFIKNPVDGSPLLRPLTVLLKDIILWILSPTLSKTSAITLTALLTIIVGVGLFYFRLKARAIYGITESAMGLIVSAERVAPQPDQLTTSSFYLAILTAAVYLFVRGLDNIHQGLTREPIDRYGSKIYGFLKKGLEIIRQIIRIVSIMVTRTL